MTRKFYGILVLVAAAVFTSSATAALINVKPNSDFYIGGHLGFTDTNYGPGWNSTGFGLDILGGYQINSMWAVEANFTHYADATNASHTESTNSFAGDAKLSLPIGQSKFIGFTKLGLANTFNSGMTSNSHLGLTMSYGVDLPILSNLTGEAIYTHNIGKYNGTSSVPNTDFYGLGVVYLLPASLFS
jgi:hypothetical protein